MISFEENNGGRGGEVMRTEKGEKNEIRGRTGYDGNYPWAIGLLALSMHEVSKNLRKQG